MKTFWKDKKVLITGHTGFKGSWLSIFLHHFGAQVSGYALSPPTQPSLFELAGIESFIQHKEADIRDRESLYRFFKDVEPEIVIHMAAQPLVRDSYKVPVDTYEINVMGTVNLLEAVRYSPSVRAVINVTTDKCYENKEWLWGYRENEPMGGFDPYSSSKACSELVTSAYRNSFFAPDKFKEHGVAIATARAGNVIGGGDWANDRLVCDCIRSILQEKEIVLRYPAAIRPWQHVLEPLRGYMLLAERMYSEGEEFCEPFNFGPYDSDAVSVELLVSKLCSKWGEKATYQVENREQLHEANFLKLDCSKACTKLKWYPLWNLDRALDTIVEWTKEYANGKDVYSICLKQIKDYEITMEGSLNE